MRGVGEAIAPRRRRGVAAACCGACWPGIAALVVITAAGGAILTFTSHILASPALGFGGLLAFTGAAAVSRWGAGGVADRFGRPRR